MVLLTTFKYSHYMVLPSTGFIHVVFHHSADQRDICQAYLQACILRNRVRQGMRLHAGEMAELRIALQVRWLLSCWEGVPAFVRIRPAAV